MAEQEKKLAQELEQAAVRATGKPLTDKERGEVSEFAESFLLLLDDTEE